MAPIHDRMPVVLAPDTWSAWLDRGTTRASEVAGLLAPALDDVLVRRAVSPRVNNVRNDDPGLLEPHPQATLGAPSEA